MEFCHLGAARRVKLWSLNANLFFEEPHQLSKFAQQVHLNHIWQRTFPFKALIAIFWDLQPLRPSTLTKPDLLRFRCSSGHVISKTKSVTPHFFTFLTSLTHHLCNGKIFRKNQCQKIFARTSLSHALSDFSLKRDDHNLGAKTNLGTRQIVKQLSIYTSHGITYQQMYAQHIDKQEFKFPGHLL